MKTALKPLIVSLLAVLLAGCQVVGPRAINSGRLTYNESIATTNDQQMLMALIRGRYGYDNSLLRVASVTANVRVTARSSMQFGFGDRDNYDGNLVPLSASASYEDNPTISYIPVQGVSYLNQVTSPAGIGVLARLATSVVDPEPVYAMLVSSINGIYNPDFLFSGEPPDPRFGRVVAILSKLSRMRRLHWIEDAQHSGMFSIVIENYAPDHLDEVNELIEMLGLPLKQDVPATIVLPVSLAIDGSATGGVGIITRSVMRLIEILSAAVELPPQDRAAGVTVQYPEAGPVGAYLNVSFSPSRPEQASVAVQYRGGWFYIEDQDLHTKAFFRLLSSLWAVSIAESTQGQASAPVLTVPVSR